MKADENTNLPAKAVTVSKRLIHDNGNHRQSHSHIISKPESQVQNVLHLMMCTGKTTMSGVRGNSIRVRAFQHTPVPVHQMIY